MFQDVPIFPLSQSWLPKAMQIFLCDQLRLFGIFRSFFSSPHVTMGCDPMINQMEFLDFAYQEFSLPLIHNALMPETMKWSIWINSWICLESDGHD
jgi:hypothetical protein